MAQPWPGKANAVAGNFYELPDGKIRLYAGGDEFRVAGTDNQGITRVDLGGLLQQFGRGLMPSGSPRPYGATPMMHDFGGLPSRSEAPRIPTGTDVDSRPEQGADLDMAAIAELSKKYGSEPILTNEPDARASEMERMRQQYGAGASFWNTDEGKDLLLDTMSNQYTGDAAGLSGFYKDQAKAGLGQLDMIKKSLGYEEGSAMAKWAEANPALALREYNKRQPNSYSGTGPSDEEIKAAMEAGQFSPSAGSPNPLGETGMARESNTAQTAAAQPVDQQRQLNLEEVERYRDTAIPGMGGKEMLSQNMINLMRRQGRI